MLCILSQISEDFNSSFGDISGLFTSYPTSALIIFTTTVYKTSMPVSAHQLRCFEWAVAWDVSQYSFVLVLLLLIHGKILMGVRGTLYGISLRKTEMRLYRKYIYKAEAGATLC